MNVDRKYNGVDAWNKLKNKGLERIANCCLQTMSWLRNSGFGAKNPFSTIF
jgi:hypothetical protein